MSLRLTCRNLRRVCFQGDPVRPPLAGAAIGGDFALTFWSLHNICCAKSKRCCRQIAGWVGVRDRTTDRATMSHLCITYMTSRMRKQRCMLMQNFRSLDIHVACQCTNGDVVARIFDVRQIFDATDIDQHRWLCETQLH